MPQQSAVATEINFIKGLITEATDLNFPESAVTETDNCVFDLDGSVYRRMGFDLEDNYLTKTIDRSAKVVNTYLWRNVSGNGNYTILVMQVGAKLYFYKTDGTGNFSQGQVTDTVTLTPVSGAPVIETVECQYADGNGYLFVTHPYCDPMRIEFDFDSDNITVDVLDIKIRDFEGALADSLGITDRPTTTLAAMEVNHKYNLYNQGWTTTNLTAWDTAQTTMPSNADVMWNFKDSSDDFDASAASIARVVSGNTPAIRGHYILSLSNQDRNTASGLTGLSATTTGFQRPSISAFFAGRVFYSGLNYIGFNSDIYFTQIIERKEQYEQCYQVNDPTSETLFDLLPTDGGVISIPEAGSIIKLFTVPGGLCVFAANGIWFITGNTGIGFTANDYSVQKIAEVNTLSASSFVSVAGYPCWWNSEGIYIMSAQGNIPTVQNISYEKIKTFYDGIPISSKRNARGFYQPTEGHIRWIYRSTPTSDVTQIYEFDRVLNFNLRTAAFYPWSLPPSDVKVNSIISTELITRPISVLNVVDSSGDNVVDSLGNQVIAFTESGSVELQSDKYLVSYIEDGDWKMTFADRKNEDYIDWFSTGSGVPYTSYFITGFKLRGQGVRKFQSNWVKIFSRVLEPVKYHFQGIWDFAKTASATGRWSVKQLIEHDNLDYSSNSRKLKVRGHGVALQFKVTSIEGEPFDIIGWSNPVTVNDKA